MSVRWAANGQTPGYRGRSSKTTAQVLVGAGPDGMLPPGALALMPAHTAQWFRKVRLMRRHPTIGLLRDMYQAALLGAEWTVRAKSPAYRDAKRMIRDATLPFRIQFLRDALRGFMDFGWQPYEVVKYVDETSGEFMVKKYKGLLQDLTTIIVDYYGALVGVRNVAIHNVINPNPVYLYRGDFACLYRDAEGTNWYSDPLMRRVERPYDSWLECDDGARRFDVKIAGSHWVVYYPEGTSILKDPLTGEVFGEQDNAYIASTILKALQSSGMCAIPSRILGQIDDLNNFDPSKAAWRVELLSPQTQQAQFVDRARYLDALMARGVGFPERSVQEGQFGTKAEAEVHADFAVDNMEMTHREILALLNSQVVDVLLQLNRGDDYCKNVFVEATPLSDAKRAFLRALYMEKHWTTEAGQAEEEDVIDWKATRDKLGVPEKKVAPGQRVMRAPLSRKQQYLKGE